MYACISEVIRCVIVHYIQAKHTIKDIIIPSAITELRILLFLQQEPKKERFFWGRGKGGRGEEGKGVAPWKAMVYYSKQI